MTVTEMFERGVSCIELRLQSADLSKPERRALLVAGRMMRKRAVAYRDRLTQRRAWLAKQSTP